MADQPPDATDALRGVRHRLGTAEDGLEDAIAGLHGIGHLPAGWRAEFESDLERPAIGMSRACRCMAQARGLMIMGLSRVQ